MLSQLCPSVLSARSGAARMQLMRLLLVSSELLRAYLAAAVPARTRLPRLPSGSHSSHQ